MRPKEVTYVPDSRRGWRPVPTRLLESRGLPAQRNLATVRLREVEGETIAPNTIVDGEQKIHDGFRDLIIGVVDSSVSVAEKLAKIETLLKEWEQDQKTIRAGGPAKTATTEGFLSRLIGRRAAAERLTESKKGKVTR